MTTFPTSRSLLNPKFEGYKLSTLTQEDHVLRFPLTARPTQANVSGRSRIPLSFEEVQSRITHNHLTVSHDSKSAVYVDDDLNVIRVDLNPDLVPTFSAYSELPKPIQTDDSAEDKHKEYPSAVSLEGYWLVSDGMGLLYLLSEVREGDRIVAVYHLPTTSDSASGIYAPFRIHAAHRRSPDTAACVLSCRHSVNPESLETKQGSAKATTKPPLSHFDALLVEIPLGTRSDESQALKVLWKARGDDVPMYVNYDDSRSAFFILGKSLYRGIGIVTPPSYEPSPDELAPIPRAGEVLPDGPSRPPSYSWTQTSNSLTIAFPLPSNVPKSAIHVTLTAKTLSLLVKHELPTSFELPRYSIKELWDSINPGSSYWTWDQEADRGFGVLMVYLDKQHEGVRWAQVFASAGRKAPSERWLGSTEEEEEEEEVPETLDASELCAIREALEKWTGALEREGDSDARGLGRGVPSLAGGELDESVDESVGRAVRVSWVSADGVGIEEHEGGGVTSSVLSVPVPGIHEPEPSLVVKSDIDGLLFTLPPLNPSSSTPSPTVWAHTATYPALSFVLASKRDLRFTFHFHPHHDISTSAPTPSASKSLVLAFESGSTLGGGNVYIYQGPNNNMDKSGLSSKEVWAKQSVLRVCGGEAGALVGVGALTVGVADGFVVLCLCERELVVVKGVV